MTSLITSVGIASSDILMHSLSYLVRCKDAIACRSSIVNSCSCCSKSEFDGANLAKYKTLVAAIFSRLFCRLQLLVLCLRQISFRFVITCCFCTITRRKSQDITSISTNRKVRSYLHHYLLLAFIPS